MKPEITFFLKALAVTIVILVAVYVYDNMDRPSTTIEQTETSQKDIVTVIKETVKKDGTKKTTTTITDKSQDKKTTQIQQILPNPQKQNRASVYAQTETFNSVESYTISYEKRLVGPIWFGVNYNTKQIYGVGVSFEF